MLLEWQEKPLPTLPPGKRPNFFLIALKFFPTRLLAKIVAPLLAMSPLIFHYLLEHYGIDSFATRGLLTIGIVGGIPAVALYLISLAHAPSMIKSEEMEATRQQDVTRRDLKAQKS